MNFKFWSAVYEFTLLLLRLDLTFILFRQDSFANWQAYIPCLRELQPFPVLGFHVQTGTAIMRGSQTGMLNFQILV